MLHTYPMFRFLDILDANRIAQPGSERLNQSLTVYLSIAKGRSSKALFKYSAKLLPVCSCNVRTVQPWDGSDGITLLVRRYPSIEHREQYVPSEKIFQFRVETKFVNRNLLTRRSEGMSNSDSL